MDRIRGFASVSNNAGAVVTLPLTGAFKHRPDFAGTGSRCQMPSGRNGFGTYSHLRPRFPFSTMQIPLLQGGNLPRRTNRARRE